MLGSAATAIDPLGCNICCLAVGRYLNRGEQLVVGSKRELLSLAMCCFQIIRCYFRE